MSRGRNRIREQTTEGKQFAGNRLAHAELNALMALNWQAVNVYGCKLYSVIEPCPMCLGAVRMAHMREVQYAVRDGGAGAAALVDNAPPYFVNLPIQVSGSQDAELEELLMAVQVEATFSQLHPNPMNWIEFLAGDLPRAVALGQHLFEKRLLQQWKEEKSC